MTPRLWHFFLQSSLNLFFKMSCNVDFFLGRYSSNEALLFVFILLHKEKYPCSSSTAFTVTDHILVSNVHIYRPSIRSLDVEVFNIDVAYFVTLTTFFFYTFIKPSGMWPKRLWIYVGYFMYEIFSV